MFKGGVSIHSSYEKRATSKFIYVHAMHCWVLTGSPMSLGAWLVAAMLRQRFVFCSVKCCRSWAN